MASTFTIERSAVIAAPPEKIHPLIADLREWEKWSPWEKLDPNMVHTYTGDPGVGQHHHWTGNRKAGEGEMTITSVNAPSEVQLDLDFIKPFRSTNTTVFTIAPAGGGSQLTWTMTGPKTLMTKLMGIFKSMDSLVGPDFEEGLANIKGLAEA